MRIAVTGATGFVGRHVLSELARHPVHVVAGTRNTSANNLDGSDVEVVQLDMNDSSGTAFAVLGKPDALIHLAWGGLPNYRSLRHFETELPTQYRFLRDLVQSGLSGLVVAGTCLEYGMQSGELFEDMDGHPNNPYGFAKDTLRRQLEYLRQSQPFALTWCRLFYVYGDGQPETSLLPQLERAVRDGDDQFDMSGGEQLRDYLPVAEVARSIVALARKQADIGIVNVSSGKPISVRRLVEGRIQEKNWNIKLNLGRCPYPDYEPLAFWGNRGKLDDFLGQGNHRSSVTV